MVTVSKNVPVVQAGLFVSREMRLTGLIETHKLSAIFSGVNTLLRNFLSSTGMAAAVCQNVLNLSDDDKQTHLSPNKHVVLKSRQNLPNLPGPIP
jgi:hypothetical protein